MCGGDASPDPAVLTRRTLLAGAAATAAGALLLARPRGVAATGSATVDLGGVAVVPRSEWGGDLAPGPLASEPDVRYLLVHHSADPGNDYAESDVAGILRGFVRFHTSAAKGWPDLAYNFMVDRFGRVWEGRTGSLAGPVAGDATGGNQGFDQLCCFIGNHQVAEPTPEAFAAMGRLLGALARRSGIPLGDGAVATFTSRGSNRHPAGTPVTTPTIAGHRDMSRTQCPGDRVFARLPQLRLAAAGAGPAGAAATTTPPPPTTSAPATTAPAFTAPATKAAPSPSTSGLPATTALVDATPPSGGTAAVARSGNGKGEGSGESDTVGPASVVAATAAAAAAAAAGAAWSRGRHRAADRPGPAPGGGPSPG